MRRRNELAGSASGAAITARANETGGRTAVRARAAVEDVALVRQLLAGDEAAFSALVERHHGALLRLALTLVSDRSVAEEVVQDTWLAVLSGLRSFEGRSTLKTWVFSILTNKAKTRAWRERRSVPLKNAAAACPQNGLTLEDAPLAMGRIAVYVLRATDGTAPGAYRKFPTALVRSDPGPAFTNYEYPPSDKGLNVLLNQQLIGSQASHK